MIELIIFLLIFIYFIIRFFTNKKNEKIQNQFFEDWQNTEYIEWKSIYYSPSLNEVVKIQSINNNVVEYKKSNSNLKYYLTKKEFYLNHIRKHE